MTITHPVREFMGMPVDPDTEPVSLQALELSVRTWQALQKAGHFTVDEVLALSEEDLLSTPGLGVRGVEELEGKLAPYRRVDNRPEIVVDPDEEDLELPPEGETQEVEWRPAVFHDVAEGFYEVSSEAQVRRIDTGTIMQPYRAGYQFYVGMRHAKKSDQSKSVRLDQLVLETFRGRSRTKKPLHLDDDPENCKLSNLAWASPDHPKFKEQRTKNAKRAAATRAAAKVNPKGKKGSAPITPVPLGAVSVEQTYRCGQVAITVNDQNLGNWPTGLSTPQDRADALKVLTRINEMDKVMGLV